MKYLYHTIKWSTILTIVISIWIVAAWLKADLKPNLILPVPTPIRYEIVAQKPTSGQEWAFQECVKVRYLQDTNENATKHPGTPGQKTSGVETKIQEGHALPLGRFLVPASGRDPLRVTPELDPVSGETKLQAQPAGGFARFGGERYAFADLLYQWQQINFPDAPGSFSDTRSLSQYGLNIGIHQGLGRIGKVELMAEGWVGLGKQSFDLGLSDWSVQAGGKLRLALPF